MFDLVETKKGETFARVEAQQKLLWWVTFPSKDINCWSNVDSGWRRTKNWKTEI